ncbi:MAG: DoxX family protein [Burkholderiales bacterium]
MYLGEIVLQLFLGAAFVYFGVVRLRGDRDLLPAFERLKLPRGIEVVCSIIALAAGAGLIVGLGVPEADLVGAALASIVIIVALISFVPEPDPPFPLIFVGFGLLALLALVWVAHFPDQPALAWLPG